MKKLKKNNSQENNNELDSKSNESENKDELKYYEILYKIPKYLEKVIYNFFIFSVYSIQI